MRDLLTCSPTLSCSSADEALYELLGINKLSLDQDDVVDSTEQPPCTALPSISRLTPPPFCHRPNTSHEPLLLVCPAALSPGQCQHVTKKGYQATNDGGAHYGPRYVTQAAHPSKRQQQDEQQQASAIVTLAKPNHHKVVVFMDTMISTWIERVIRQHFDSFIQEWNHDNTRYIINPRLRLLRYDAVDEDIFVSHYDATTTTIKEGVEYESKLTILVYLNDEFEGGETVFLNSLNPNDDFLNVAPSTGQVVVFNHELYHASRELRINNELVVDGMRGGTKFVLRSDVMFEKTNAAAENDRCQGNNTTSNGTSILEAPPSDSEQQARVFDIIGSMEDTERLQDILEGLDGLHCSVRSFLVPGRPTLTRLLVDLGLDLETCETFLTKCEASLQ